MIIMDSWDVIDDGGSGSSSNIEDKAGMVLIFLRRGGGHRRQRSVSAGTVIIDDLPVIKILRIDLMMRLHGYWVDIQGHTVRLLDGYHGDCRLDSSIELYTQQRCIMQKNKRCDEEGYSSDVCCVIL